MTGRAVPFHCPYCGDDNLWPFEARRLARQEPPFEAEGSGHGAWECRACLRAFKVTSAGLDDYVTAIVRNFLADRADDEGFAAWATRADEALLRGDQAPAAEGR